MNLRLWWQPSQGFLALVVLVISSFLVGCSAGEIFTKNKPTSSEFPALECPVTEPQWLTPPDDPAISGSAAPGFYYVNQDDSIWASAWWYTLDDIYVRAEEEGLKVGWFRPEGVELEITGERIDGKAEPLHAQVPCCYPTRFQSTGLFFPEQGCWQVDAIAGDSSLSFVLWVFP